MPTISSSRVKPVETPLTALAASARVSPWSAAWESFSRISSSEPPSCLAVIPAGTGTRSLPFGPSTCSSAPIFTVTPFGSGIGFLPTLDMSELPNLAEQLSADAFLARVFSRHHPAWRSQDVDAQPALHARNVVLAHVH